MPSIADLFVTVTSDVSGALSGLTSVDQKVNGTSAAMSAAAPAAFALAGAATAVGGAFLASVSQAADFEKQINGIKAVMSPAEVNEFGDSVRTLALTLGKDTVFTSAQAADAIQELIKAGVPLPAILDGAARSALDLASATGTEVTVAAGLAATAMTTFHLSAEQLPEVMNTISQVSNATATSVDGLRLGLSDVGSVANQFGLSFQDTALALGVFAQNGLTAQTAGTAMKTMLTGLIPQSKEQTSVFQQLGLYTIDGSKGVEILTQRLQESGDKGFAVLNKAGADGVITFEELFKATKALDPALVDNAVSAESLARNLGLTSNAFFDANGKIKSMTDIAGILHTALAGMSQEQQAVTLQILFGTQGMQAAAIAASEGADGFTHWSEEAAKMAGVTESAAQRNAGLAGALNQLGGSFEAIQIQIGSLFLPILTQLVNGMTTLLNAFLTLPPGVQATIAAVVGITGAVAGLLAGFILLAPVFASVGTAFGIIAAAAGAVALPIAAVVAAGALLYAAWQTDFGGIREVTEQVGVAIQPAIQNIQNFLQALGSELGPAIAGIQSALAPFIKALSNDLAPVLAGIPGAVRLVGDAFNVIGPVLQGVYEIIRLLVSGDFRGGIFGLEEDSGLVVFFLGVRDAITLFYDAVLKLLNGDFSGAWNSLWSSFTTVLQVAYTAELQLLQAIGGAIRDLAPGMWQALVDEFAALPGQLAPLWDAFTGWLSAVLAGLPQYIGDAAGDIWAALRTAFDGLVPQLAPAWDAFAGWLGAVLGGMGQFVADTIGDIWGPLRDAFYGLVDQLAPAWDAFAGWLGAVVGGIGQFIIDNMGDPLGGLVAAFYGLVDQLAPAWDAFAGWLGNVLAGLPQFVADHIGDVWGALIAAFTGSTPGTTTTGGGTPAPEPGPIGTGTGITGPLVNIGTLVISTQEQADAFLDLVAQAVLASARRVSPPVAGSNPVLG